MRRLRFNTQQGRVLMVGDLHFGHDRPFILGPRKYADINEALGTQRTTMYNMLRPDDVLFNLGDCIVGAGERTNEYAQEIIRFPCKHQYFIWGNHNAGMEQIYRNEMMRRFDISADDAEIYPLTVEGTNFTFLGHYAEIVVDGVQVVLAHYPIESWNGLSKGAYMIHGHCHRNLKDNPNLKRLDVSWDWLRRPATWEEIHRELHNRETISPDHHG